MSNILGNVNKLIRNRIRTSPKMRGSKNAKKKKTNDSIFFRILDFLNQLHVERSARSFRSNESWKISVCLRIPIYT